MWLDGYDDYMDMRWTGPEWPEWALVEPRDSEPCLVARYSEGAEIGPYYVVLPQ